MNKRQFSKINRREGVANTIAKLIKYSKGCLNKKQLEKIANFKATLEFRNNNGLGEISSIDKVNIGEVNPYIRYTENTKEFSELINDSLTGFEHSWAGEETHNTKVNVIIGNCSKGKVINIDYSDNGNIIEGEGINEPGNFDIDDLIVVYRWSHDFSDYNNNYYNDIRHEIVIYNGNKGHYDIDDEIKYIMDNFNI